MPSTEIGLLQPTFFKVKHKNVIDVLKLIVVQAIFNKVTQLEYRNFTTNPPSKKLEK